MFPVILIEFLNFDIETSGKSPLQLSLYCTENVTNSLIWWQLVIIISDGSLDSSPNFSFRGILKKL